MTSSDIMNTLRSANQAFEAGVRAGDGAIARKLRCLIAAAEEAAPQLECVDIRSAEKLRAAIAEAKR